MMQRDPNPLRRLTNFRSPTRKNAKLTECLANPNSEDCFWVRVETTASRFRLKSKRLGQMQLLRNKKILLITALKVLNTMKHA